MNSLTLEVIIKILMTMLNRLLMYRVLLIAHVILRVEAHGCSWGSHSQATSTLEINLIKSFLYSLSISITKDSSHVPPIKVFSI
jgi:hypothetical protein